MTHAPAAHLALQLGTFATRTVLPIQDGSSAILGLTGMAFLAKARKRAPEALWFRQTPTYRALRESQLDPPSPDGSDNVDFDAPDAPSPLDQCDFVLVVQWRRLLSKALLHHPSTSRDPPELRHLAHQAWWALMPLLEDYDVVLAQLIGRAIQNFRAHPERVSNQSMWVGFDTKDDELRFDAQVTTLLASRRTAKRPFEGFCEAAGQWFAETFKVATNDVAQRNLGLCTVSKHVRGGYCDTCPEIAQERKFLLALDVPALLDQRTRRLITQLTERQTPAAPSVQRDCIRWIIDTRSRLDGTCRFNHITGAAARFIDVKRLWERWRELGMKTMFDDLTPPNQIEGPRQARAYFNRIIGGATLPEHNYAAKTLFVEADWGSEDDFDTSYSQFIAVFESTLLLALQKLDQRAYALVKARTALPVIPSRVRQARRVVTRKFIPMNGDPPIPISIIRALSSNRQPRNFYTLPYEIDEPMQKHAKLRTGKGILYNGQFYWSWRTVNELANQFITDAEPVYPWAREFCDWIGTQEPLLNDTKLFNNAIYSERLPKRLEAISRGDMAHLGSYSDDEDQRIVDFFINNPAKKRLSPQDWTPLLERLPGRNERGILKRFEELGKKYAFSHGYQAYKASPYCRKFAAGRRAQWLKEGCPA